MFFHIEYENKHNIFQYNTLTSTPVKPITHFDTDENSIWKKIHVEKSKSINIVKLVQLKNGLCNNVKNLLW